MQTGKGDTFVVPRAQESLTSSPPMSLSSLQHPEWLSITVVVGCPVIASCCGTDTSSGLREGGRFPF